MRKSFWYIILFFTIVTSIWMAFDPLTTLLSSDQIVYEDNNLGISFVYPETLSFKAKNNTINLHHEIDFQNSGECNMTEEGKLYYKLTDFDVTFLIFNEKIVNVVKKNSSYIPEENYRGDELLLNPGFIDEYSNGNLNGFSIYEGAEGCGHIAYYFKINENKTLLIKRKSIQHLSGVRNDDEAKRAQNAKGVIGKTEENYYFESIMKSLKIN